MRRRFDFRIQNAMWLFAALAFASCSSTKSGDESAGEPSFDAMNEDLSSADGLSLDSDSGAVVAAEVSGPHKEPAKYKGSRFPRIAATPFQKGGYWMNSYYFVRGGESWEDISRLIYDRGDRASLIASWNEEVALAPGALIYYNSPFPARANDSTSMKGLAADFGIPTEKVIVTSGDWLSTIAGERYGQVESWREIAALNQDKLASPDKIEIGQELEVLPVNLNTKDILRPIVEIAQAAQVAPIDQNNQDTGEAAPSDAALEQELDNAAAAAAPPNTPEPGQSLAMGQAPSMITKVKDFLSTHGTNILGVFALLAFSLAAFLMWKKKRSSKKAEREITLNMDILDAGGTAARGGVTSSHPMN